MRAIYSIFIILGAAPILLTANGSMSIGTFLKKAEALEPMGVFALASSDYALLKTRLQTKPSSIVQTLSKPGPQAQSHITAHRQKTNEI